MSADVQHSADHVVFGTPGTWHLGTKARKTAKYPKEEINGPNRRGASGYMVRPGDCEQSEWFGPLDGQWQRS